MRLAVETAKRILTKEKIDKQLAGQTSSTPLMIVKDGLSKRVTFNTADDLEHFSSLKIHSKRKLNLYEKIDRLTVMMGKLVTEDEGQSK